MLLIGQYPYNAELLSLFPACHLGDALGNLRIVVLAVEDFAACAYGEEGHVAVAVATAYPADEGAFVDDVAGCRGEGSQGGIERFLTLIRFFLQRVETRLKAFLLIVVQRDVLPESPVLLEVGLHHFAPLSHRGITTFTKCAS